MRYQESKDRNTVRAYDSRGCQVAVASYSSQGGIWTASSTGLFNGSRGTGDTYQQAIAVYLGIEMTDAEMDERQSRWAAAHPDDDNGVK